MKNVLLLAGLRIHTVPKVASTSISAAIGKQPYGRVSPDEPGPEWRFMVVRHPLDRLVSGWRFFTPASRLQHMRVFRHPITADMRFEPFVRLVLRDATLDRHTTPQTHWAGGQDIDQLARLENIGPQWATLARRFGLRRLPLKNPTDHEHWSHYFTPGLARDALEVYGADLELYEHAT